MDKDGPKRPGRRGFIEVGCSCYNVTEMDRPTGIQGAAPADGAPACPMCGSGRRILDPARQETHCSDCGLVFDESLVADLPPTSPEDPVQSHSGRGVGPFNSPGGSKRNLGSTLTVSRDGQGRRLDWHRRYEFQHLRRVMQRQTSRVVDGPLDHSQARSEIAMVAERLGVPSVIQAEAERIYALAKVHGLYRGRSLPATVGASMYAACRRYSLPRTLGEIATAVGATRAEVGRTFKVVQRGLPETIPSIGLRAFLQRYADELALSPSVRSHVEEMLAEAQQNPELSGISPHGLVAALIYLAAEQSGEHRSRAQVARVSAITEVTLRSTSRLVERLFGGSPDP